MRRAGVCVALSCASACGGIATGRDGDAGATQGVSWGADAGVATGAGGTAPCNAESWAARLRAPIVPPRRAADLDLAGPSGAGLTLADLARTTCGDVAPDPTTDKPTASALLDPGGSVFAQYATGTGRVVALTLVAGYSGALALTGADGAGYVIRVGAPITKDGAPFVLSWSDGGSAGAVDELYRALLATFAPAAPASAGSCVATGECVLGAEGDAGWVTFARLGTTLWVASTTAAQPGPSTPSRIDQYAQLR